MERSLLQKVFLVSMKRSWIRKVRSKMVALSVLPWAILCPPLFASFNWHWSPERRAMVKEYDRHSRDDIY